LLLPARLIQRESPQELQPVRLAPLFPRQELLQAQQASPLAQG
jgi:hypothetical protein